MPGPDDLELEGELNPDDIGLEGEIKDPPQRAPVSGAEALVRGGRAAAGFGFGDEMAGIAAWLKASRGEDVPQAARRGIDSPTIDRSEYAIGRDAERAADRQAIADTAFDKRDMGPVAQTLTPNSMFGVGEVGGTVLTAAAPVGGAAKGAALVPRAKSAAKVGGALGGVTGFGNAEGGLLEQAAGTVLGAGAGAVLGPVLGEGVRLGARGVRALGSRIGEGIDRLTGGRATREITYGGPEGANKAEMLADPASEAGKQARADALAGENAETVAAHERAAAQHVGDIERTSAAASTDPAAIAAADKIAGGAEARAAAYGSRDLAAQAEALADPANLTARQQRATAAEGADPQVIERKAKDIGEKVSELWEHGDVIKWEEDIASKRPLVRRAMEQEKLDPRAVGRGADKIVDATEAELTRMAKYISPQTPDGNLIGKLQRELAEYRLQAPSFTNQSKRGAGGKFEPGARAAEDQYGAAADRFMRLDELKRQFQKTIDIASKQRGSAVIDELRGVEESLRTNLEDSGVWGRGASALQQVRNRGWRQRLLLEGRDAAPERTFMSDASGEAAADPYRLRMVADPGKVHGIVKNVGVPSNVKSEKALREWADREAGLLEALTTHADPSPELVARAQRARALSDEINAALGQRGTEAEAARAIERIPATRPQLNAPPELGGRVSPTDVRARIAAVQNAERAGMTPPQGGLVEIGPPAKPPALPIASRTFDAHALSPTTQWAREQLAFAKRLYGPESAQAQSIAKSLGLTEQTAMRRATEAGAARDMAAVTAAQPPAPGPIRKVLEAQPVIGPVVQAMRPTPLGERARLLARLEEVQRQNPSNRAAQLALGIPSKFAQQARPTAMLSGGSGGLNLGQRVRALAQSDPSQLGPGGAAVAQAKDDDDFAVKHAALMATDQKYREGVRKLAQQPNEETSP